MVIIKHFSAFVSAPLPTPSVRAQTEAVEGGDQAEPVSLQSWRCFKCCCTKLTETIQSIDKVFFYSLFLAWFHIDHSSLQTWCLASVNQILACISGVFLVTPLHKNVCGCALSTCLCPFGQAGDWSAVTFCIWQITFTVWLLLNRENLRY